MLSVPTYHPLTFSNTCLVTLTFQTQIFPSLPPYIKAIDKYYEGFSVQTQSTRVHLWQALLLKSPLTPVPSTLVAFFSNKIRKMTLNFEIPKVLKWPSMLGLPALHSWLLVVFRVRCKLLGTARSSFWPLAPNFLPFLLSLFQRGWPQKRLFPCAAAQAHQPFTDFSRWPGMLPRLSLFPLVTGYHHFARDWTHGVVHAKRALCQGATFEPSAHFPLALSSPLVYIIIAHLSVTWQGHSLTICLITKLGYTKTLKSRQVTNDF